MTLGVCGLAIPSELGTLPLRTQTQGVIAATQAVAGWVILFTVPYMINPDAGNLGGKVGFVFFGFGVICTVLLFFFLPETKGLSFEDVRSLRCERLMIRSIIASPIR
jgi:Sugar (and other) transporter